MRRLLLNILTALSLLPFVAAVILCVRSYWVADSWKESREDRILTIWSEAGKAFVEHEAQDKLPPPSHLVLLPPEVREVVVELTTSASPRERKRSVGARRVIDPSGLTGRLRKYATSNPGTIRDWHFIGFHWFISEGGASWDGVRLELTQPCWRIGIPLWSVALVFSLLPLARAKSYVKARQRERRRHMGLCENCGYDLRASPECCPECGVVPPQLAVPVTSNT